MKYTLQNLFKIIDEKKTEEEYYYSLASGGWGVTYYLNLISEFNPDNDIVVSADCYKGRTSNVNINQEIDVDGILVYLYIPHNEDYKIIRLKNMNQVVDMMHSKNGLLDNYIGDILVIENGTRKKYCVKDKNGIILNWDDIDRVKKEDIKIYIEWH